MNRTDKFIKWMHVQHPDKDKLLGDLEKAVRLIVHVHELTGIFDEKLYARMAEVSKKIKEEYEKEVGVEN